MKYKNIKQKTVFKKLFIIPIKNGLFKPTKIRGSGTKMIGMGEIFSSDRINDIPMELVPLTKIEEETAIVKKNDLLFARSSLADDAGKCSIFCGQEKTTFESHIIRVRINEKIANPMFYYYYFNSRSGKNLIYSITEKTAASGIRSSDLSNLSVLFLPKNIQDKIVNYLDTIDNKINTLNNQNKILEQMTQAIFKSQFVDFDGTTEFENSELGKIPKGWSVDILSNNVEIKKGRKPKDVLNYKKEGYLPQILLEMFNTGKYSYANTANMIFSEKTDTLMVMDGISSGRSEIGYTGIVGSTIAKISFKRNPYFFHYIIKNLEHIIKSNLTGSAIPHVDKNFLNGTMLTIPTSNILNGFEKFASILHEQIDNNKKQVCVLIKMRYTLLHKLISGEIRV